jgi:hypothetical protein
LHRHMTLWQRAQVAAVTHCHTHTRARTQHTMRCVAAAPHRALVRRAQQAPD